MKKTTKKQTNKDLYIVKAQIMGRTYEYTGETVLEALSKFEPRNVKGFRCIISVERAGNKKDRILMPLQVNRLFNSHGMMREVAIKNCATLFQGI